MFRIVYIVSIVLASAAGIAGFKGSNLLPFDVSTPPLEAAQEHDGARLKELGRIIEREIGTPAGTEPSQCKVIAYGSKPCGGPARYLVYSTAKTDESPLKELVSEFNQLAKKINQEGNIISDCMFVAEPEVKLTNGICTIRRD